MAEYRLRKTEKRESYSYFKGWTGDCGIFVAFAPNPHNYTSLEMEILAMLAIDDERREPRSNECIVRKIVESASCNENPISAEDVMQAFSRLCERGIIYIEETITTSYEEAKE